MMVASYKGKKPHGVFYTDDRNCIHFLEERDKQQSKANFSQQA